jgi:diaminopimelate epimerase
MHLFPLEDERFGGMERRDIVVGDVPFWKMSGSGNDFIVVDNRDGLVPADAVAEWTRRVCRPHTGLGADGVVMIEALTDGLRGVDFRWRYLNADGSIVEMCGNGAMCGARFAVDQGIAPNPCAFETPAGIVRAEVRREASCTHVVLDLPDTGPIEAGPGLGIGDDAVDVWSMRAGVPHAVLFVPDAEAWPNVGTFASAGRAIRHHQQFAPAGTNVDVVTVLPDRSLRMRTYERGVEAETLSCGTGAVASAIVAAVLGSTTSPVTVWTSSGSPLHVSFHWDGNRATAVQLGGRATVVARGVLAAEATRTTDQQ